MGWIKVSDTQYINTNTTTGIKINIGGAPTRKEITIYFSGADESIKFKETSNLEEVLDFYRTNIEKLLKGEMEKDFWDATVGIPKPDTNSIGIAISPQLTPGSI